MVIVMPSTGGANIWNGSAGGNRSEEEGLASSNSAC